MQKKDFVFTKTIVLAMKLTILLLTVSMLHVSARTMSQTITYTGNNVQLEKLFPVIKEQTGYVVFCNAEILDGAKPVSVSVTNVPIEIFLDQVLKDQPLEYAFKQKTIVINRKNTPLPLPLVQEEKTEINLIDITGKVLDENGKPLAGASVIIKKTSKGTYTNNDGVFSLSGLELGDIITVTFTGYNTESFKVGGKSNLIVKLRINDDPLDQVVVRAYDKTTQRFNTGGIQTITAKQIENKPITNPLLALQGEVPGMVVQQSSGFANSGIFVQIRGINSLSMGTDPLYVVDGVPYTSQLMETVNPGALGGSGDPVFGSRFAKSGNPLSFINPADIESISILKDADATSIYGSKAAAGAIIITTKKGKSGPTKLNIKYQEGWGKVARLADLLDRDEYLNMRHQAKINSNQAILPTDYDLNGTWDTTRSTDWQKTLLGGTARFTDVQLSSSGGTDNTKFLIGVGYHKETGVLPIDVVNTKASLHFNITTNSPNQKFNLQLSGSYMLDNDIVPYTAMVTVARTLSPVAPPIFNKDGSLNWQPNASGGSTWNNPLAASNNSNNKTNNLVSSLQLSYEIVPKLRIKSSFGYNNIQLNEVLTIPTSIVRPERRASFVNSATYSNGAIRSWIVEPMISYENTGRIGKFEALIGGTLQYSNNNQQLFRGTGYSSDQLLQDPASAAAFQYLSTTATTYKYNAFFGKVNYRLKNKYIINLSARRDGSSRFGSDNLFHNFASIGTAWIFSDEKLVTDYLKFLSFGKLQFSYGTTGNDQIGDYQYLSLYTPNTRPNNYQGITGLDVRNLSNPYLQWEETKKMQLALELGFVKNRLLLNVTYFRNRSSNQLLNYKLPELTGFTGYTRNFPATLQNSGLEISLNAEVVKNRTINWNSRINLYIPQNKLIAFRDLANSSYASGYRIGSPITETMVYMYAGVNAETGLYQFKDSKGNITANPSSADMRRINRAPAYTGGVNNTISYKGFQLDVLLQCSKQWTASQRVGYRYPGSALYNQPKSILENQWSGIGDQNATTAKFLTVTNSQEDDSFSNASESDFGYINCYLVRVKNVSFSWNLPEGWRKRAKIQNGQIFLHAQNLFTLTNFIGGDPEVGLGNLGPIRMVTAGVQLTF